MRLIDADALGTPKVHGRKNGKKFAYYDISKAPTIDAIPIEWLEKNMQEPILRRGIHNILYLWQKEQEAKR